MRCISSCSSPQMCSLHGQPSNQLTRDEIEHSPKASLHFHYLYKHGNGNDNSRTLAQTRTFHQPNEPSLLQPGSKSLPHEQKAPHRVPDDVCAHHPIVVVLYSHDDTIEEQHPLASRQRLRFGTRMMITFRLLHHGTTTGGESPGSKSYFAFTYFCCFVGKMRIMRRILRASRKQR